MSVYKPNAIIVIDNALYLVAVKKKDERNLSIDKSGINGQRFRLLGQAIDPKRLPERLILPSRNLIIIDPQEIQETDIKKLQGTCNMYGDFSLDEVHRTRFKIMEKSIGQRFEGYFNPFKTLTIEENTNQNIISIPEDEWL